MTLFQARLKPVEPNQIVLILFVQLLQISFTLGQLFLALGHSRAGNSKRFLMPDLFQEDSSLHVELALAFLQFFASPANAVV